MQQRRGRQAPGLPSLRRSLKPMGHFPGAGCFSFVWFNGLFCINLSRLSPPRSRARPRLTALRPRPPRPIRSEAAGNWGNARRWLAVGDVRQPVDKGVPYSKGRTPATKGCWAPQVGSNHPKNTQKYWLQQLHFTDDAQEYILTATTAPARLKSIDVLTSIWHFKVVVLK